MTQKSKNKKKQGGGQTRGGGSSTAQQKLEQMFYGLQEFEEIMGQNLPEDFKEFEENMKQYMPTDGKPRSREDLLYEILNHPDNPMKKQSGIEYTKEKIEEMTRWQGRPFSREEMIKRHREQRSILDNQAKQGSKEGVGVLNVGFDLRNPYYPIKPDADMNDTLNYSRMFIRDLIMNTTHKEKVLRGRIIEPPIILQGLHSIIEDYNKDVLQVSVYNTGYDLKLADKFFKVGNELSIYDPFYKSYTHGGAGVRVERPEEIYVGPARSDLDKIDHRTEGNALYKGKNFNKAAQSYTNGLKELAEVSKVLGNIAACLLKLDQQLQAMAYSCASVRIDTDYAKGWQRLLHTLQISGNEGELINTKNLVPKKLQSQIEIEIPEEIEIPKPALWTFISSNIDELSIDGLKFENQNNDGDFSQLKLKGNELFKEQKYMHAIQTYIHALQIHQENTATLLSNRAMCELHLGQFKEATYDATASLIIKNENNDKAAYRRVQGLRNMAKIKTAIKVINGDKLYGNLAPFQTLKEELKLLKKSSDSEPEIEKKNNKSKEKNQQKNGESSQSQSKQGGGSGDEGKGKNKQPKQKSRSSKSTPKFDKMNPTREDLLEKVKHEKSMEGDEFQDMIQMIEMFEPQKAKELKEELFDDRVPEFFKEYIHEGHLPPQSDFDMCRKWLCNAQFESKMATKRLESMKPEYDQNGPEFFYQTYSLDIHRRLGSMDPQRMMWFLTAPIGDNNPLPKANEYPIDMAPNFSTSWQKTIDITYGTTHVMIGYLDLGHLLFATYRGEPSHGPIRVYGYEQSPYCTAKTSVIINMMQKNFSPKNIFQVWFSSGWSKDTLKKFRTSVSDLLENSNSNSNLNLNSKVTDIFKAWLKAPDVTLLYSQQTWLQYHPHHNNAPANFLKKQDRLEIISYMLTGRLFECDVGSVVMFSNPPFIPHMCHNEYITEQIREYELIDLYNKYGSIMPAIIHRLLDPLTELKNKILNQNIIITLYNNTISPNNKQILREIRALEPYTIHWSNLVDYYNLHDFHKMVKACSGEEDTVHYMYSMNWVRDIKGASCLDYPLDVQLNIIKQSNIGVKEFYQISGVDKFLMAPPCNHPWNEGDSAFAGQLYQKWTDKFFRIGGVQKSQVPLVFCEPYSLFSGSKGNIFFCYTYDKSVKFYTS